MPCSALRGSTRGLAGVCIPLLPLFSVSLTFFDSLDDHFFDALTARTCNDHPLPCSDACVSEADAASVFALGDFEYELRGSPSRALFPLFTPRSYIWHAAQNASTYTSLTFGCVSLSPRSFS